jgi:hypothetical protein
MRRRAIKSAMGRGDNHVYIFEQLMFNLNSV